MLARVLPLAVLLTGCIEKVGPGPDLGACAEPPEGIFTFGEIGIGTCLAGPVDMQFIEQDGQTFLAVVNADPFVNFTNGSVLLLDWEAVDIGVGEVDVSTVATAALPLERYLGGVGYVPDREILLVTGRLSEDAITRTEDDQLWLVDASEPGSLSPLAEDQALQLEADPQPVVVHEEAGRAYVLNITSHTVSVIDTTTSPLSIVDATGDAEILDPTFLDLDDSGSTATLYAAEVTDAEAVPTEVWTLHWVDGTRRIWVADDGGLTRLQTGGGAYVASGITEEIDPDASTAIEEVIDPFLGRIESVPVMYFEDQGAIRAVSAESTAIASWDYDLASEVLFSGGSDWDQLVGAPVVVNLGTFQGLYYAGRAAEGEPAAIGLATTERSEAFRGADAPIVEAPEGFVGIDDPLVNLDPFTGTWRMWASLWDGSTWSIGHAESVDGEVWGEAEPIFALDGFDVGAPVVTWSNGRYLGWFAVGDGTTWSVHETWSYDGLEWAEPLFVVETDAPYEDGPPRVALQTDTTGAWRIEGADLGALSTYAEAGAETALTSLGFAFRVANGFHVDTTVLGDQTANGVLPSSYAAVGDEELLYVTGETATGLPTIGVLEWDGADWVALADDLIPAGEGGNVSGAASPAVFEQDGGWTMLYGGADADGLFTLFRAVSDDGVAWEPTGEVSIETEEGWDDQGRLPHSVETTDDGLRLWYSGFNGSRWRIGAAVSTDGGTTWTAEPGDEVPWQLGTGLPGEFDDTGVRDPMVFQVDDTLHMFYAGSPDGEVWRIGHAQREVGETEWIRTTDASTGDARALLGPIDRTFADQGLRSPVVVLRDEGVEVWYGGSDGARYRVGRAIGEADRLFPAQRFPTVADEIVLETRRGSLESTSIPLDRTVEGLTVSGIGASGMTLDEERGFLYVFSKLSEDIFVIDVRDDGDGDTNFLDVEAVLRTDGTNTRFGYRDVLRIPDTDLLYATARFPDTLVVIDASAVIDDDQAQLLKTSTLHTIPLETSTLPEAIAGEADAGPTTLAVIGGAQMALSDDGLLWVTHFRGNALDVFDLAAGPYGSEIAHIDHLGENPYLVRLSPDGRYAVVANYLGEVDELTVSSTLVVVDADPDSPTFLQPLTWITNR